MIPRRVKQILKWGRQLAQDKLVDTARSLTIPKIPLPERIARKQIVLVGASVGKDWRLQLVFPNIRTLALYEFDKSPYIRRAIRLRPDAIIIKECAAYFPSDEVKPTLLESWVRQIRSACIRPILATVVPVTRGHAASRPGRAEGLWRFNDWLRELAVRERVPLLDLEASLRVSEQDRHLADDLAAGDGLHLTSRCYRQRLDPLVVPLLLRTFG